MVIRTFFRCAMLAAVLSPAVPQAAAERYEYDAGGRLIRRVDDLNRATDYLYDAAGNILQVTAPAEAQPPVLAATPLADLHRNEIRQVVLAGSGLAGVSLRSSHPGIAVSNVVQSATTLGFRLSVAATVPLGAQELLLQNAVGSTRLVFQVVPALAFVIEPSPIGLAPDGIARLFSLKLGEALPGATSFTVSTLSPAIARPKLTSIELVAGQMQADFGLIGVGSGNTLLRLSSSVFVEPVEAIVFVAPGSANPLLTSQRIGISKGIPWAVSPASRFNSGGVGVARGLPWTVASTSLLAAGSVGISKGVPWLAAPASRLHTGPVGVARGIPWAVSAATRLSSGPVGIARGSAWFQSGSAGPLVAPLVGIVRQ